MTRAEKRKETAKRKIKFIETLNERFFSEFDKEKPDENGLLSVKNPMLSVHSWVEKLCHKYPHESSFFLDATTIWLDLIENAFKAEKLEQMRRKK